ncbi:MAG: DNA polymerase I [Ruminococcus sp.]|jgi:DNA polymerase I-like protein with 3'-5' exonuclease and polymerase domains|nr:DNA polymerase I [Ruminococcus sp.]
MSNFLIIDGNSIINRAYYGIKSLSTQSGIPTNAITGFFNIYHKTITNLSPDYIAVAFDLKDPTFRHKKVESYKANRKGMPDDLAIQLPYVKQILKYLGVKIIEKAGYEADDIIGTIAALCEKEKNNCTVLTGDRDSFQLITDLTSIYFETNKGTVIYDKAKFIAEYNFQPVNIIDLKAFMGDSSDNIKGVPGIGEKTAKALIEKYSTVENVYNHIDEIKQREKLVAGKDSAFESKWLAEIVKNVPIENLSSAEYRQGEIDYESLKTILKELEMYKMLEKYTVKNISQMSLFGDNVTMFENSKKNETAENITPELTIAAYLLNKNINSLIDTDYEKEIEENNLHYLYYEVELPLSGVLADMEKQGITVDAQGIKSFGDSLKNKIEKLTTEIQTLAGKNFNIASPRQLGDVLFGDLGFKGGKKTKTGYSTNAETLEKLAGEPIIDAVLEYRKLTKLNSTYVEGLLKTVKNGKIHTHFKQTETRTGRLASAEPNLQNIPVRTELGREMRKFFTASPGKILIDADYSQIELRILASMSDDANMLSAFENGIDIHTLTASQIFGISTDSVTKEMRTSAKAINFGIMYGMGEFSLSKDLGISVATAKNYIRSYLDRFPNVSEFMDKTVKNASETGFVHTLLGRKRFIPELLSSNKQVQAAGKRIAMNTPIQGTAADIIKIAMVNVHRRLAEEGTDAKLLLQIHDELLIESSFSDCEKAKQILKQEMEQAFKLSVKLEVDIHEGENWYVAKG